MMSSHIALKERSSVIDALRGIAIVAVVLGHANIGVVAAGLAGDHKSIYSTLTGALYLVHMPLFALLMGLNMPSAWEKRKHPHYLLNRVFFFFWLFLLWTFIQGGVEVLASRFQNGEGTKITDVLNLWVPIAQMWFLPWAIITSVLVLATQPWKKNFLSYAVLIATGLLAVFIWADTGTDILHRGMALIVFTVLGAMVGLKRFVRFIEDIGCGKVLLALLCWGIYLYILLAQVHFSTPSLGDPYRTPLSILLGATATVTGVLAICLTVGMAYRFFTLKLIEKLGKLSLPVFLVHLVFTPATRVLLVKLGITQPLVIDLGATLVGILSSVAVYYATRKWAFWLFELPWNISAEATPQSAYSAQHIEG